VSDDLSSDTLLLCSRPSLPTFLLTDIAFATMTMKEVMSWEKKPMRIALQEEVMVLEVQLI
jgi:hypothetical protein